MPVMELVALLPMSRQKLTNFSFSREPRPRRSGLGWSVRTAARSVGYMPGHSFRHASFGLRGCGSLGRYVLAILALGFLLGFDFFIEEIV